MQSSRPRKESRQTRSTHVVLPLISYQDPVWDEEEGRSYPYWQCDEKLGYLCAELENEDCLAAACAGLPVTTLKQFISPAEFCPELVDRDGTCPRLLELIIEEHEKVHRQVFGRGRRLRCAKHSNRRGHNPCAKHVSNLGRLTHMMQAMPGLARDMHAAAEAIRSYEVALGAGQRSATVRRRLSTKPRGGRGPLGWSEGRRTLEFLGLPANLLPARRDVEAKRGTAERGHENRLKSARKQFLNTRNAYWRAFGKEEGEYHAYARQRALETDAVFRAWMRAQGRPQQKATKSKSTRRELSRLWQALQKAKREAEPLRKKAESAGRRYRRLARRGAPHPKPPKKFWTEMMRRLSRRHERKLVAFFLCVLAPSRYRDPEDHSLLAQIAAVAPPSHKRLPLDPPATPLFG